MPTSAAIIGKTGRMCGRAKSFTSTSELAFGKVEGSLRGQGQSAGSGSLRGQAVCGVRQSAWSRQSAGSGRVSSGKAESGKAGQVRYWQYGQAERSPDLAISDLSRFPACVPLPRLSRFPASGDELSCELQARPPQLARSTRQPPALRVDSKIRGIE